MKRTLVERIHSAWIEGVAILIAVLISSLVTATNDYKKEKKFKELYDIEQAKKEVEVIREGKRKSIHPDQLVVGDLALLKAGMEVIGDGIVIEANCVETDESSMTGESDSRRKEVLRRCVFEKEKLERPTERNNFHSVPSPVLMAGTKVASS